MKHKGEKALMRTDTMSGMFILFCCSILFTLPAQDVTVYPQLGHSDLINSAAYSPDGSRILSCSWDETIKIWDALSGRELKTLSTPGNTPLCAVWDAQGLFIAAGFWDGSITIWDMESETVYKTFLGHQVAVNSLAFSPDGQRLASASFDCTIKVWELETGTELHTLKGHTGSVHAVLYSPDGGRIYSGSSDGTLRIWDGETGRELGKPLGMDSAVHALTLSPDGARISSGSFNGAIMVWDARTGALLRTMRGNQYAINALAFNPEGSRIVSGSIDKTVRIWDPESGVLLKTLSGHQMPVMSVAWSPAGRRVLSGSIDKTTKEWDAESGALLASYSGYIDDNRSVSFRFDAAQILSGSANTLDSSGVLRLWDPETGALLKSFTGHSKGINTAGWSPDGKSMLSGSGDASLKVWDAESGTLLATLSGHTNRITYGGFSPEGTRILSASWDSTLKVWDAETGAELRTLSGNRDIIYAAAWSPDGKRIISGCRDGVIKVWDAETGKELYSFQEHADGGISALCFSPEGRRFVYSSGAIVKVCDGETGDEVLALSGHEDTVNTLDYSSDGKWILSASGQTDTSAGDKTIRVWDAQTGEELLRLSGHSNNVHAVAFSPDDRRIISGSSDGTIRLWTLETGGDTGRLSGKETVQCIGFSDGEWICITPEGYYNASPQGDLHLNVRVGDEVFGMDNFRGTFYKPEAVAAALAGDQEAYLVAIGGRRIQDAADFLPPKIEIQNPAVSLESTVISVAFIGETQPVKNIRVIVRGHLVVHEELGDQESDRIRGTGKADNQERVERAFPLDLKPGWNSVEIIASNGYSDDSKIIELYYPGTEFALVPNLWILAVGVNQYEDAMLEDLSYAAADAEGIISSFKAQEGRLYGRVNSLLISGRNGEPVPTRDAIMEGLSFLNQASGQDMALLFIAGHGVSDRENNFLFLPGDAAHTEDMTVWDKAISRQEIDAVLRKNLGQKLIVIDACHSAGVAGGKARSVDSNRLFRDMDDGSTIVLTSCRGNESSLERAEYGHGLFTYSIIQAMKGDADLDIGGFGKDGMVTLNELNTYIQIMVPRLSSRKQNPTIHTPAGFSDFNVADLRK
ncbi:MAG: caspase family protein [Treponema sp.]|nr:caspase family protein [Treponema sp.]